MKCSNFPSVFKGKIDWLIEFQKNTLPRYGLSSVPVSYGLVVFINKISTFLHIRHRLIENNFRARKITLREMIVAKQACMNSFYLTLIEFAFYNINIGKVFKCTTVKRHSIERDFFRRKYLLGVHIPMVVSDRRDAVYDYPIRRVIITSSYTFVIDFKMCILIKYQPLGQIGIRKGFCRSTNVRLTVSSASILHHVVKQQRLGSSRQSYIVRKHHRMERGYSCGRSSSTRFRDQLRALMQSFCDIVLFRNGYLPSCFFYLPGRNQASPGHRTKGSCSNQKCHNSARDGYSFWSVFRVIAAQNPTQNKTGNHDSNYCTSYRQCEPFFFINSRIFGGGNKALSRFVAHYAPTAQLIPFFLAETNNRSTDKCMTVGAQL